MPRVDSGELGRWWILDAVLTLAALAGHAKRDPAFETIKNRMTTRWYANVAGLDFELLLTGLKFFDTRAEVGGGGAIDLAMQLLRTDFKTTTRTLRQKRL